MNNKCHKNQKRSLFPEFTVNMRNMLVVKIFLCLMAGCISCNHSTSLSNDFIIIDVTAKYPKKELILQDFLDVEYIPLETTDDFITYANVQAVGKDIMIFKSIRWDDNIFIFDRSGKGLRKINRGGQGPEEYTIIHQIVLDEEKDEMYVTDIFSKKILVYDLFGNFKRSLLIKDNMTLSRVANLNKDYLICYDDYFEFANGGIKDKKRNCFLTLSKENGEMKEIPVPYMQRKSTIIIGTGANGAINDRGMHNREFVPYHDNWILTEASADTIYSYSPEQEMKPFMVRTPSIQSMNLEIFLFPGILTDRYYFMQAVRKEYDFIADTGFPRTDLVYDRQKQTIFECAVYNNDFTNKTPMSMVWEYPMFTYGNNEIAFIKRLEPYELIEAYQKGQLKGQLKEIATQLDEESNPVIMLAKYKE